MWARVLGGLCDASAVHCGVCAGEAPGLVGCGRRGAMSNRLGNKSSQSFPPPRFSNGKCPGGVVSRRLPGSPDLEEATARHPQSQSVSGAAIGPRPALQRWGGGLSGREPASPLLPPLPLAPRRSRPLSFSFFFFFLIDWAGPNQGKVGSPEAFFARSQDGVHDHAENAA